MNWIRLQVPFTEWAIALASDVLPVPGTSSTSRCPSLNTHTRARAIWSRLPLMTCSTLSSRALNQWLNHSACWSVAGCMGAALSRGRCGSVTERCGVRSRGRRARAAPRRVGRGSRSSRRCRRERSPLFRWAVALFGTADRPPVVAVALHRVRASGGEAGAAHVDPAAVRRTAAGLALGGRALAPVDVTGARGVAYSNPLHGAAADGVAGLDPDRRTAGRWSARRRRRSGRSTWDRRRGRCRGGSW